MPEPISPSAAAGAAAWNAIGGAAGASTAGAGLAAVVVMLMTPPRSKAEWVVGLISTVIGSVCGGAFVIEHYGLQAWANTFNGLLSLIGLAFACGLPAWSVVRWSFTWMLKRHGKDLGEVIQDAKRDFVQ
ncbi:hypothetical protein LP416_27785 [Polaromonas sp. P2-4]|nr:hypothetical protein LP416_27785 [Polaromonas sp. P2-4]